jgi:hypothetical protein
LTLWEVQNICYPALGNAFEEKGWGASADPAMQQYFDHLARRRLFVKYRSSG